MYTFQETSSIFISVKKYNYLQEKYKQGLSVKDMCKRSIYSDVYEVLSISSTPVVYFSFLLDCTLINALNILHSLNDH